MRAGTFAPHMGAFSSPEAIVRAARQAEALDYQTVWVAERVLYPLAPTSPAASTRFAATSRRRGRSAPTS